MNRSKVSKVSPSSQLARLRVAPCRAVVEALEARTLLSVSLVPVAEFPGHLAATGTGGARAPQTVQAGTSATSGTSSATRRGSASPAVSQPITLTSAFLVDSNDNPVTTPDKGEEVFIEADWNTQNLPASASYKISYSIDGVTLETGPLTFGAGSSDTQPWFWYLGGWYASPGAHNVTVSIDPTTYSTTTEKFSFTPVSAPDLPEKFITPLGGIPQQTWGIVNYVDVNPLDPNIADYKGGDYTYDGHTGHDMTLADFGSMDAGVPDYAAADGTVVAVQDGNYDRNTSFSNTAQANYVEIDHGNGWHTIYYHFRKDSILVHVGDQVVAGQVLGLAGSSGFSTAAHLHFEVQHNGDVVEEEYDPTTFWVNPPPYQGGISNVLASGITSGHTTTINDLTAEERPVSANTFSQAAGQELTAWIESFTRNNDAVSLQFYAPDGTHEPAMDYSFTASESHGGYWYTYQTLPAGLQQGTWQVKVVMNGTVLATDPFYVTFRGAGAARVSQGSTYVSNGRTTPIDFGVVAKGAAAPQLPFTVSNIGSAPLSLAHLSLPAGFSLVGSVPASIPVGGSATLTVQMDTSSPDTYAGPITFNTSDPTAPTYGFNVTGTVSGASAGEVHGQVFLDGNTDGIEDNAEDGLAGWNVMLYNPLTGNVIGTTTTSFNGYYTFYNVAAGTYQVRQSPPASAQGASQTTPDPADVTVKGNDVLASPFGVSFAAAVADVTPTDLLSNGRSALPNAAAGQRSTENRLLVSFNQPVSLSAGAFSLQLLNSGGSGKNDNSAPTDATAALGTPVMVAGSGGTQWYIPVVPRTAYSTPAGSLADGVYTLTVHAASVTASGAPLPDDGSFTFHCLYGDTDGNKTVNAADFAKFKAAFGSSAGSASFNPDLDTDNNGTINAADYAQFKNRFGKTFIYA